MNDLERLIALNMVDGLGSVRVRKLLDHFISLEKVFKAKESDLLQVEGIGYKLATKIPESIKKIDVKKELDLAEKHNVKIVSFLDTSFPENLKNIYDPPVILYIKGEILKEDNLAIAVIGSRLASSYGTEVAYNIGFELASRGITVISGLARGIDSMAHKGALKSGGRTLAVLGSGILNIYPKEHLSLANEISRNGVVLSEFPMRTTPLRRNFPRRNRIVSGLSLGVVVVEAAERSGALITSEIAMEQGRDVFAIPGKIDSITSKGTHQLIKQGAKLVESIEDILEEFNLQMLEKKDSILDKRESLVYTLLSSKVKNAEG